MTKQELLNKNLFNTLLLETGEKRYKKCRLLLQKGASISAQHNESELPIFMYALETDDVQLGDLFIKKMKKIDSKTLKEQLNRPNTTGETIAFKLLRTYSFDMLLKVLELEALNVSHKNKKDMTIWNAAHSMLAICTSPADFKRLSDFMPMLKKAILKHTPDFDFNHVPTSFQMCVAPIKVCKNRRSAPRVFEYDKEHF